MLHTITYSIQQTNSGAATGAWGRGAPVSKPSSSSNNGERPKLNLSKKTEPKDKENNTVSPTNSEKKVETSKPVEKRGWEVKPKSTESEKSSKKDIEEKLRKKMGEYFKL